MFTRKILAVVIARSGSKGIKNKNLSEIGGKPLIAHIIETAVIVSSELPMDIVMSTDSREIQAAALAAGASVPFIRPTALAEDHVPSLPVVQHAVLEMERQKSISYEIIVYLQPTSPLCRPVDISECITKLVENELVMSAVAVTEVETHPFRMKRLLNDGRLINYIDQGFEDMRPRQMLPKVYRRAGSVYVSRREVVMEQDTLVGDPCIGVVVPNDTAVDIDTPIDLEMVRMLYDRKKESL